MVKITHLQGYSNETNKIKNTLVNEKNFNTKYEKTIYYQGTCYSTTYGITILVPDTYVGELLSEKRDGYQPTEEFQGNWIDAKGKRIFQDHGEKDVLYVEHECEVYSEKTKCYEMFKKGLKKAAELEDTLPDPDEKLQILYRNEKYINEDNEEQLEALPEGYQKTGTILYIGDAFKDYEFSCTGWLEDDCLGCEVYSGNGDEIYVKIQTGRYLVFRIHVS